MSYAATVYHVLIASPSDVADERDKIAAALYSWNALHAREQGIVLLPVMWETHSAPMLGDRAQEVINRQLVRSCDMLVGAFWTRIGSPTGADVSGTIEEIRWFLNQRKPVMLYYSQRPLPQDRLDVEQWTRLNDFKAEIRTKGLQETYADLPDLSAKLIRQLTVIVREMRTAPSLDVKTVRKAQEDSPETGSGQESISLLDYSEKSFVVSGNSLPFKDDLQKLGGKWLKTDRAIGWMFSKRHLKKVAAKLGVPETLQKID